MVYQNARSKKLILHANTHVAHKMRKHSLNANLVPNYDIYSGHHRDLQAFQ